MKEKDYTQTVEAYKDARNKPSDEEQGIITHWQNAERNPPKETKG
jgi:hypothetical protein